VSFKAAMTSFGVFSSRFKSLVGVKTEVVLKVRSTPKASGFGPGAKEPVAVTGDDDDVNVVVEPGVEDGSSRSFIISCV